MLAARSSSVVQELIWGLWRMDGYVAKICFIGVYIEHICLKTSPLRFIILVVCVCMRVARGVVCLVTVVFMWRKGCQIKRNVGKLYAYMYAP